MAGPRFIDIGVEGNDGTGDSIRESFRKVNENFNEVFGLLGPDGQIFFTSFDDTPSFFVPNTLTTVNANGSALEFTELASNSAVDENQPDTITFEFIPAQGDPTDVQDFVPGKLVISTAFTKVADDQDPTLGGPLNAAGSAIANVGLDQESVTEFNNRHGSNINIDNLVISKGFADQRYLSAEVPVRVNLEPENTNAYILEIQDYAGGNIIIPGHGFTRQVNGTAYIFKARYTAPINLTSDQIYYLRFESSDQLSLFENKSDAELIDDNEAASRKIFLTGEIEDDDSHTLTDAAFDPNLSGNFLSDVALPRESVVRRQGDTMQGELYLSDHPGDLSGFGNVNGEDDLLAASKLYVDNSAYSSPENLFVSTFGDDNMVGIPRGREGTALPYAFRTIGAAARRAAEIIETSPAEPGPYFQTITTNNGEVEASVVKADIVSPQNEQTRKLIEINQDFLVRESIEFLNYTYPDFEFDRELFANSYSNILQSLAFDINRGETANFLTRKAAETFYNSIDGRIAISRQLVENLSGIQFLRESLSQILQNFLFRQKSIESINVSTTRAQVVTVNNHNYENGQQVYFKDLGPSLDINNLTAYIRVINDTTFELYTDKNLEILWDIRTFADVEDDNFTLTPGGRVGLVFQERIEEFQSIKIGQTFDEPDAEEAARLAIDDKFSLIENILQNGIEAGADERYGNDYKIVLDNANQTFVDQANPDNTDTLPGKIMVGKISGAKGRIISVTNNDPTENNNDTVLLQQISPDDFLIGEAVEYGNFVKKKQVTIFVESGIYEEDLPIKLSNNVSLKGDEFRRVIIRPRNRISQSIWADTYFYRDIEFDDIPLLETRHSEIREIGTSSSTRISVDRTDWLSENLPVKFTGNNLIGTELEKNTVYYVKSIDEQNSEIEISDTEGGTPLSFASNTGTMYVFDNKIAPFLNQTNQIQGYFGRHYLRNPFEEKNVGSSLVQNSGGFTIAASILETNKAFIQQEVIAFITENINTAASENNTTSIWFNYQYNQARLFTNLGLVIDSIIEDMKIGGIEFCLETQGIFFERTDAGDIDQTQQAIAQISAIAAPLLAAVAPQQNGSIRPDISLGEGEDGSGSIVGNLVSLVNFAFDDDYNPPKKNNDDGVDVFQMSDATIVRNATVQGHGGFMVVLDPEEQILTKSPYIQTGSSFSKSDNVKRFRGGMYVDAFVGNIPARITEVINPFELRIQSDERQGLRIRPPQLPCPFYLDGIRYQVNALGNYDSGTGTARIVLDKGSNPDGSGVGQGYQGSANQEIFLQTAGNRSMLGNDFTQINDLGYGLVTNNGAFSEMVSMFTYYCQAAYYAKNGSEIRSLNGSNGYGFFGLVAEGADPNEIPDQVTLRNQMVYPAKAYTSLETPNEAESPFIYVYDLETAPTVESIITIDHGLGVGVLNYRISNVENWSDRNNDGIIGNSPEDIEASSGSVSNIVYRLSLVADNAIQDDFFGELQTEVLNNTFIEYRNNRSQIFDGIANVDGLETRPSTAINYDESDAVTYRSLAFSNSDSLSQDLPNNTILATIETDYDFIRLEIDTTALSPGLGANQGDTRIPVVALPTQQEIDRLLRDIDGNLPEDAGYNGGGMIFSFAGKTHRVTNYITDSSVDYIEFEDFTPNISAYSGTGLAEGIPTDRERSFYAGLPANSTAEITQAISLLRATGHDFTQIGTGSFNDSNYPNVILGEPENDLAEFYTDSPVSTKAQVWERRKGRVFFVSTDQDGFFRVGKFFSVDQSTGDITFAGEIGLSDANSLGFTRGVTVNEFSADDSFSDNSGTAVPTERAATGYINRVLGYNVTSNSQIEASPNGNRIGPGFLPLNGSSSLEGNIDMGGNVITNLDLPGSDGSAAASKNYVDDIIKSYDELVDIRNFEINNIAQNDLIVATGKKRIFVTAITGGVWNVGDRIGTTGGNKEGVIVDIESRTDKIEGNVNIVTYTPSLTDPGGAFIDGDILFDRPGETATATIIDGPFDEVANAREKPSSIVNVDVERNENEVTYNLQIQDESIVNADISTTAGISQSKLNLQAADNFDEDDAVSGWSGTATKTQSDLGLAKFSDENFEVDSGFVRIKQGGIVFAEIQNVPTKTVIGRNSAGSGETTSVDFSTVVTEGGGLADIDFANTVVTEDLGFPGEALVKLDSGNYGVTEISSDVAGDTIARRKSNGFLDAAGYRVGGYDFVTLSSTSVRLQTPGGAEILSAIGNVSSTLVTRFPGNVDVGSTQISQESNFQAGSALAGEGWIASDWIYSSFIEAPGERDASSTGIGIGANTGFENAGNSVITLITDGSESVVISADNTDIKTSTVTFDADLASNFTPDSNSTRNLGSNSLRFNTVYADVFNGVATEAKYADLAENYTGDSTYDVGTVLVFGGDAEVTVTNTKGDRRAAGIVSANPAYLMNSGLAVPNTMPLALQGRVLCKVLGKAQKGDLLVTSAIPGYAVVDNNARVGTVIGKCLENKDTDGKDIIEVVVGRV